MAESDRKLALEYLKRTKGVAEADKQNKEILKVRTGIKPTYKDLQSFIRACKLKFTN